MVRPSSSNIEHDVITPIEALGEVAEVRRIAVRDLGIALRKGLEDFRAIPSHALFLGIIYVAVGLMLARIVFGGSLFALFYPIVSGFALLGPFAAVGLYELSRRREEGRDTHVLHVFDIRHSPSFGSILLLGAMLTGLFVMWIAIAHAIFTANFGYPYHATFSAFVDDVLFTPQGRQMMLVGNLVGLAFAIVAMAVSVVAFPLMLDRHVGVAAAVTTSLKAIWHNPVVMAVWGFVVATGLLLGSLPLLIGLAIVLPVLGHATWHLYRRLIPADRRSRPPFEPKPRHPHYAAEFPASLFVPSSFKPGRRK